MMNECVWLLDSSKRHQNVRRDVRISTPSQILLARGHTSHPYLKRTQLTEWDHPERLEYRREPATSSRVKHPANSAPVSVVMELARNASSLPSQQTYKPAQSSASDSNAYLYIIIVLSFYGVFLTGIMLGYLRTKRREKRRTNAFTWLLHAEEQREWGASQKKPSFSLPTLRSTPVPFLLQARAPLACALCSVEQSSVSSLSSATDVRFTIEEESDSGGHEDMQKTGSGSENNSDGSATENLKDAL